jgi:hypothetical protein
MQTATHRSHRAAAAVWVAAFAFAAAPLAASAQHAPTAKNPLAAAGRSETTTETATIKSIDPATRHLVLTNSSGQNFTLKAPKAMHNFDALKVGDKLTATYSASIEFALSPGRKLPPDTQTVIAGRAAKGELPAGVVANHIVVTGAVLGIDMQKHTLKVVSPQGGEVHIIDVTEAAGRAAMAKLKVGDYITAYITEGLLLSARPA